MASPVVDPAAERPIIGVRAVGDDRLRFARALPDGLALADWVLLETDHGDEPCRVVVAPGGFAHESIEGDLAIVSRRLDTDEIERAIALGERARVSIPPLQRALTKREVAATVIGLRFTLGGATAICLLTMPPAADTELERVRAILGEHLGMPVVVERRDPAGNLFGGLGRLSQGTLDLDALIRSRFPRPGMSVFAPEGLPRLGSRVVTTDGVGVVIGVSMRSWRATVRLDDDREIAVPVESLSPAPE